MTQKELSAFKEKWRIMWHPEVTEDEIVQFKIEDEILALVDIDEHTSVEPRIHSEVGSISKTSSDTPKP